MTSELRKAEAGDICVLLYPESNDRALLRKEQESLVKVFGGWMVPEPHITLQRFRLPHKPRPATGELVIEDFLPHNLNSIIDNAQESLSRIAPFPVCAAGLTQFLAPFWSTYVLRWEVERDAVWNQLISSVDAVLQASGCELHYDHEIVPTCSAVDLTHPVRMDEAPLFAFPRTLFTARRLLFTGVLGLNDFETLGGVKIGIG